MAAVCGGPVGWKREESHSPRSHRAVAGHRAFSGHRMRMGSFWPRSGRAVGLPSPAATQPWLSRAVAAGLAWVLALTVSAGPPRLQTRPCWHRGREGLVGHMPSWAQGTADRRVGTSSRNSSCPRLPLNAERGQGSRHGAWPCLAPLARHLWACFPIRTVLQCGREVVTLSLTMQSSPLGERTDAADRQAPGAWTPRRRPVLSGGLLSEAGVSSGLSTATCQSGAKALNILGLRVLMCEMG